MFLRSVAEGVCALMHEMNFRVSLLAPVFIVSAFFSSVLCAEEYLDLHPTKASATFAHTRSEPMFSASFEKANIHEFIKTVAANINRTIMIDPQVRGEVTVRSYGQLTSQQYYQLFLSVLSMHGYVAVEERSGIIKVIQEKDGKTSALRVLAGKTAAVGDEMVTWVLPVNNVPANALSPILRQLVDTSGSVVHYDPSNLLVLTGRASNLRRVVDIVTHIDRVGAKNIEIFSMQHIAATEMENILKSIFSAQARPSGGGPIILSNESSNQIIVSADSYSMQRIRNLVNHMDVKKKNTGNIRVFYLEYAEAKDLKPVLENTGKIMVEGKAGASKNYSIEVHEQTNAVVINAQPDVMAALESVIEQLDIRRAQVMVEAIIVEVAEGDGINLSLQLANANGTSMMQFQDGSNLSVGELLVGLKEAENKPGNTIVDSSTGQTITNPETAGDFTALAAALAKISGAAFSITKGDWTALLQAVKSSSESNILATPSLLTLDNEEASFIVGDEVPTLTGSTPSAGNDNPYQTIDRKEVGIKLSVTPQINGGDAVQLDIEQEVSNVNGRTPVDITFSTRKVKTSVLAKSGDTIVIGGLLDENVQESVSKVPLLGDIPLLGHLFRSTSSKKVKKNLMVFLRPTIIRDDVGMNELSGAKYDLIRAYQLDRNSRGIALMPFTDKPMLPKESSAAELLREYQRQLKAKQDGSDGR